MHILNNLTFAILIQDGGWKSDLTIRFCEYYSRKINNENFIDRIIFPESVDAALEACQTDYLLIQNEGNLTISQTFFDIIEECADEKTDLFLSHVEISEDYLIIKDSCIFINMILWHEMGRPSFNNGIIKDGPNFKATNPTKNKYTPGRFIVDESSTDKCYVPSYCQKFGSDFTVKQLEAFSAITCLPAVCTDSDIFFLDNSSPYLEIMCETALEKKFISQTKKIIFLKEDDDMTDLPDSVVDLVIAPAQGLKPSNLVDYFKAKELIIFDSNPLSLEFQKMLFSVKVPTIYGDVVREFLEKNPTAIVAGEWEQDEFCVVIPQSLKISYKLVDAFSCEMLELIQSTNHSVSAVIDLSDIYVYPINYYRRPMYQVQGLFAELYSQIKSRTGATYLLGLAPGFIDMVPIPINIEVDQFKIDGNIALSADDAVDQKFTVEISQSLPIEEIFIKPSKDIIAIKRSTPIMSIRRKPAVSKTVKSEIIDKPPNLVFKPEDTEPINVIINKVEINEVNGFDLAATNGYSRSTKLVKLENSYENFVIYSKVEKFIEFEAVFDYNISDSGKWKFSVGRVGTDKRVEFASGDGVESFIKHLNRSMKINSKTAVKHFI